MMNLLRDIRYSARSLWRAKGFSIAVIATMALCIGANTTILSALYGLVLKPLPVKDPERLVRLYNLTEGELSTNDYSNSSWNQYSEYRGRDDLFEGCAYRGSSQLLVSTGASFRKVNAQQVSAEFFDLMGARPLLGRFFLPEEVEPGPGHVVVLSQTTWESEYNADPNVIGQQILLDKGVPYVIVGVAPRSMEVFDYEARFTIPYDISRPDNGGRYNAHGPDLWLRLKPDVTRASALEQIVAMERYWYEEVADANFREDFKGYTRFVFHKPHHLEGSLYLLEGGALLLLLLGCFNVLTLIMSRVMQRRHELSIRGALGARKFSLGRLMLVESWLLLTAAICAGMVLAWGGTHVINQYLSALSPKTMPFELNGAVLAATLAVTAGVACVMGLLPLEILWRAGLLERVDSSQRTSSAGGFSKALNGSMVIGQVAIAFVMLVGAGLLVRSFQKVMAVEPGFQASQVVQGRLDFKSIKTFYQSRRDAAVLKRRIYEDMQQIPGVESVSFSEFPMFASDKRGGERVAHLVSPEFFSTMRIPIVEGRAFNPGDDRSVAVVDELYAKRYFPGRSAIGLEPVGPLGRGGRIVGVVGRANFRGLEERDGTAIVYWFSPVEIGSWEYSIFVRTSGPADSTIKDMRAALYKIDPRLAFSYSGPLDEALDEMLLSRKGIAFLLSCFAGLALLLSAIGIYGVLAYDVQQRHREFGIRAALGAMPRQVLAMVLRQGLVKVGIGLALGLFGAMYATQFLASQLFDITSLDPWTYSAVLGLLLLVALAASYLPARRAVLVDPMEALRTE